MPRWKRECFCWGLDSASLPPVCSGDIRARAGMSDLQCWTVLAFWEHRLPKLHIRVVCGRGWPGVMPALPDGNV